MSRSINDLKAIYFSHDCNARNDEKLIKLRMKHGAAGYGVYFMLLERFGSCTNYIGNLDYELIAYELREDIELIEDVIENFQLFQITKDKSQFFSNSFQNRMTLKDINSINGIKGNLIRHKHATKEELDKMSNDDILKLNSRVKQGASSGASSGASRNKEINKEINNLNKKERENKDMVALDFLKLNYLERLNNECGKEFNKINKNDKDRFIDSFNNKIKQEIAQGKIKLSVDELIPRLKNYLQSWLSKQIKEPEPNSWESGKLPRKN